MGGIKMKISIRQLRRIIRESIEEVQEEPLGSPMLGQIKKLATVDPMQAFMMAQSFPDFESMDLSFIYPELVREIAKRVSEQIPESSYPEMESSADGWDIGFEFADRPKRFYAADGMNLTDAQVEERRNQERELVELGKETMDEYADIIVDEFSVIGVDLESKFATEGIKLVFNFAEGKKAHVELGIFKNWLDISFKYSEGR